MYNIDIKNRLKIMHVKNIEQYKTYIVNKNLLKFSSRKKKNF